LPFKEGVQSFLPSKVKKQPAHGTVVGLDTCGSSLMSSDAVQRPPGTPLMVQKIPHEKHRVIVPVPPNSGKILIEDKHITSVPSKSANDSHPMDQQSNITAVKRILRVLRVITMNQMAEDGLPHGRGASVQEIYHGLGKQRHTMYTEQFVAQVLHRLSNQATVKVLSNGNYVLAAGNQRKTIIPSATKKLMKKMRQMPDNETLVVHPGDQKQVIKPTAAVSSSSGLPLPPPLMQPTVPPLSIKMLQQQQTSSGLCNVPTSLLQHHPQQPTLTACTRDPNIDVKPILKQRKTIISGKSILTSNALSCSAEMSVAGRYLAHTKKQAANILDKKFKKKQRFEHQHILQGMMRKHNHDDSREQRGRPVSKRKKFKKNLGPDFLEPSDLGLQYLTNSFEPKCNKCGQPASKSIGVKGKTDEFLVCKDCGLSFHPTCLSYSSELAKKCRQSPWQCMYCKDCCKCDGSGEVENILLCDACDKGYHMDCHEPRIRVKPSGSWICSDCLVEKTTGKGKKQDKYLEDEEDDESSSVASEVISGGGSGLVGKKRGRRSKGRRGEYIGSPPPQTKRKGKWKGYALVEEDVNEEDDMNEKNLDDSDFEEEEEVRIRAKNKDNTSKILALLKPGLDSFVQIYPQISFDPNTWSVEQVETFVSFIGFTEEASLFREQEVDGLSLLLLKRNDVLTGMNMKLGPAVKIYGHIQRLQMMPTDTKNLKPSHHINGDSSINGISNGNGLAVKQETE